ncbi:MAG: Asp-tRNA(Asn)/Glu-tRNA(Gln) amidotransferase subunit GatB [Pseudomonadota bacterium]
MTNSSKYEIVIGLEVHAQLRTRSKMFCSCPTTFGDEPNTNICPVCSGQPGALPTINKFAVELAVRAGLALGCKIHNTSQFARKNYFYPDLTKGYQITQFERPICTDGKLGNIRVSRIQIEEDAGKSLHDQQGGGGSLIDYNRCSVPLIEIISGPDIRTPEEAGEYLKSLRSILQYLEVCEGNMQEGNFRCDANISLRPKVQKELGTRTETKNLNSFKAVESVLKYETGRQTEVLNRGKKVIQQTLLWNDTTGKTSPMRGKEEAHDYRYFPEPDLIPLIVEDAWVEKIKDNLPELPDAKAKRFHDQYDIPEYDAGVLTAQKSLADYYEKAITAYNEPKKISNWIMTELLRELKESDTEIEKCLIRPEQISSLVRIIDEGKISGKIGKDIFGEMYKTGHNPEKIIESKGLKQISSSDELEKIADEIIANNPKQVEQYKSGKEALLGYFVGQMMKQTKGQANPNLANEIFKKKL